MLTVTILTFKVGRTEYTVEINSDGSIEGAYCPDGSGFSLLADMPDNTVATILAAVRIEPEIDEYAGCDAGFGRNDWYVGHGRRLRNVGDAFISYPGWPE